MTDPLVLGLIWFVVGFMAAKFFELARNGIER